MQNIFYYNILQIAYLYAIFQDIYIIGERIYGDDLIKHNKLRKTDYLVYKNIPCSIMSEKEIIDTSNLFSEHYGVWSSYCPDSSKCNERVKFPPSMIKKEFCK